jgi:hypothetical protein
MLTLDIILIPTGNETQKRRNNMFPQDNLLSTQ